MGKGAGMLFTHCNHIRSGQRRVCGFTIIELLISVAVTAVLAAIAIPSFREINVRMRTSEITNEIVHAMHLARAEAVKRGVEVVVESGATWADGWSVKEGAEIILSRGPVFDDYEIQAKSTGGGVDGIVTFRPTGSLVGATSFDFNVCRPADSSDAASSKRITVQGSGTVNSRPDTTGSPAGSCP